jgi:hypothetical protein
MDRSSWRSSRQTPCPHTPGRHASVEQKSRWSECGTALTRKRPSHELTGIGRFSQLYSENGLLGEMATSGGVLALAVATLLLRAACRSSTWAYRDVSQSILFHPFSGWPFIHTQHKRLLPEPSRIPHHQYALSAPRPQESNCPSRAGAAQMAPQPSSTLRVRSGSHLRLLLRVASTRVPPTAGPGRSDVTQAEVPKQRPTA